jgi:hypothetical protein
VSRLRGLSYVGPVRRALAIAVALLAAASAASLARADGDPASDILPTESVYFPIKPPSNDAQHALASAVGAVYANGNRLKVAVIATQDDLGAIPSLMNKPDEYAKFLGQELMGFYVGPLLIVMPNGFGVYDGGRSVAAENEVLHGIGVDASSVDDLVRSAATAVQKLQAANALKSEDIRPPYVFPQATTIRRGRKARFTFRLLDDSNRASVAVRIVAGRKTVAMLHSPLAATNYPDARTLTWSVPKTIPSKHVRLCMTATDAAGNTSTAVCQPLTVAKQ